MDSKPSRVPLPALTADQDDVRIIAADVLPVGDLAGVDLRDLLDAQVGDGFSGLTMIAMPS